MRDLMVDLETFGVTPGSVIRSIGAVPFDRNTGATGKEFYYNIQDQSCLDIGMTKDQSTIDWWAKPKNAQANSELAVNQIPIHDALQKFIKFWIEVQPEMIWSQGGNFDEPLLSAAMRLAGLEAPWEFWNARCTRTAYDVSGFNHFSVKRAGTYHNALADCKHQIICVHKSFLKIGGKMV